MAHIINLIEIVLEKFLVTSALLTRNIKYSHLYISENVDNLIYLSKLGGKIKLFSKASNTKLVQKTNPLICFNGLFQTKRINSTQLLN